jgi:uncharacterized protein DUF6221
MRFDEFLAVRLEEDAVSAAMREVHAAGCEFVPRAGTDYTYPCKCGVPERMMREVVAKREILAAYGACQRAMREGDETRWRAGQADTLRAVAENITAVYRDHPDYQDVWGS